MNKKLENFLINEQILNNFSLYEGTPLEKLFKSNLPEEYQPRSQNWFKLPFYMVPFSSEDKLINVNDLDFISENLVINENSKKYYPFFMHPVTQNAFKGWLGEKYKFVGNDESYFSCTPTSSFRTLLVKNEKTGKHFFVKVTLLDNVGGVFRKIDWESAFNQFQANEIVQKILKDETEVDFFKDIAAFGIRNDIGFQVSNKFVTDFGSRSFYVFANVIRKIPDSLLIDDGKIVCSFSSYTSLLRKEESFLSESLKKSGLDFKKYFEKYIFLPLKKYLLRQFVN
ncbi:MAG: hypothetical protein HUJ68_10050, partial [Clostridia bacterium]|nr:hypothetical protein [Clostridia bacterium]